MKKKKWDEYCIFLCKRFVRMSLRIFLKYFIPLYNTLPFRTHPHTLHLHPLEKPAYMPKTFNNLTDAH